MTPPVFTERDVADVQLATRCVWVSTSFAAGHPPAVMVLRFGTVCGGGPLEVTTEIVLPCLSTLPGVGDWEMIDPTGARMLYCDPETVTWKWSEASLAVAACGVRPSMLGTLWVGMKTPRCLAVRRPPAAMPASTITRIARTQGQRRRCDFATTC